MLKEAGPLLTDLVDGLLEHRQIGSRDLCDYAGLDRYQASSIISELVRQRAIIKEYSWYVKKPAFKEFLRILKARLAQDTPVTVADEEADADAEDEEGASDAEPAN